MAYADYEYGDGSGESTPINNDQDPSRPPPGYRYDWRAGTFVPIDQEPFGAVDPVAPVAPVETGGGFVDPYAGGGGGGYGGGGYGGGGGGSIGSLIAPFTGQAPQVPSGTSFIPQTPQFRAPSYTPPPAFSYEAFQGPNAESVLNDPGYKFRLNQGEQALQQSAAARGVLNGGGTLKDILGYGQDFASQEYGNVWNRDLGKYQTNRNNAFGNYMTNYQTQYADPYAHQYQAALDTFAPEMTAYSTQAQAGQRASELNYNNLWNQYLQQYDQFRDQRDSTFDKKFKIADA